jgi:hypothetical protein
MVLYYIFRFGDKGQGPVDTKDLTRSWIEVRDPGVNRDPADLRGLVTDSSLVRLARIV